MTIHKSDAVSAGIMPDYARAGVVLCRSAEFVTSDDSLVSGDTLQMVPVPKGAKILGIDLYYSDLPDGVTGCDVGYGGDVDAFMASLTPTGTNFKRYPGIQSNGPTANDFTNLTGWLHTFTADDTIDITFPSAPTKIPTSQHIKMAVYYKMTGVLNDEE